MELRAAATDRGESPSDRRGRTELDFEQLLLALCSQANGDVHLDLAELDGVELAEVVVLMRASDNLAPRYRLVLHNAPESVRRLVALFEVTPGPLLV